MTDKEQIWRRIAEMETPGFFITADIMCEGSSELDGLEVFIKGKITQIQQGITGRKFRFSRFFVGIIFYLREVLLSILNLFLTICVAELRVQ